MLEKRRDVVDVRDEADLGVARRIGVKRKDIFWFWGAGTVCGLR